MPWARRPRAVVLRHARHKGEIRVQCFAGCQHVAGDVLKLIAAAYRLDCARDFKEVLSIGARLAGLDAGDLTAARARPLPRRPAPPPEPPPLDDSVFAAIVAPLLHCGRLDGSPLVRDVERYLDARGLLGAAQADGWAALPPPGPTLAAWVQMLSDVFEETALLASGLFYKRKSGELALPWPDHRLVIPCRSPAGAVYTLHRRLLRAPKGDEQKYAIPRGRPLRWPYGVEQLASAPADAPIAFVEGAVDVLAIQELDRAAGIERVVLGVPGLEAWGRAWADLARGRRAFVATDADEKGRAAARFWIADLLACGALDVQRVEPAHAKDWAEELARKAAA